jgi:DNA (cytosine-5)-methyltransferase 1
MPQPVLLDAFCGAGGAARGYQLAGFTVVGVDHVDQPHYAGDVFIRADAVDFITRYGSSFDAIHASPPCQAYTPLRALSPDKTYPDLLDPTRAALASAGTPYVIENVMSAPLRGGIVLCGGMFGLRTYRHRRFEPGPGVDLIAPVHPPHLIRTATKQRRLKWDQGWHVSITGDVGTYVGPQAMGIDWMSGNELCEAIPPAYTEWIGRDLLAAVRSGNGLVARSARSGPRLAG